MNVSNSAVRLPEGFCDASHAAIRIQTPLPSHAPIASKPLPV
jgi:hypothetical protein